MSPERVSVGEEVFPVCTCPVTRAGAYRLRRICIHFWMVAAAMLGAYRG